MPHGKQLNRCDFRSFRVYSTSPDLTPCDIFLFPKHKRTKFEFDGKIKEEEKKNRRYTAQDETFYLDGIIKHVDRLQTSRIDLEGSYVEK